MFYPLFQKRVNQEYRNWKRKYGESYHAWTINTKWTPEPHLATELEGRFVGNRVNSSNQTWWKGSRVQQVCLLQGLNGDSGWGLWTFALTAARNLKLVLPTAYDHSIYLFFLRLDAGSTSLGFATHFSSTLYIPQFFVINFVFRLNKQYRLYGVLLSMNLYYSISNSLIL